MSKELKDDLIKISTSNNHEELKANFTEISKKWQKHKDMDAIKAIIIVKDERKGELDVIEYNKEIDAAEAEDTHE
jgi:hypothetical protein